MEIKGKIFDIQGLSVHDGPGCRTVLFMQGCTLNCDWCSNPEGISLNPTILYDISKCRLDGACVVDCSHNAIKITNNKLTINRNICQKCTDYSCLNNCYTKALMISSKEYEISEIFKIIKRDRSFWGQDGGITLSGGEPLLQINFVEKILKKSYDAYIHTAIETCGNVPWNNFERVLPYLDWIFFDIKNIDSDKHKENTGVNNLLILDNAKKLASKFEGRLIFRMPVIPDYNNSEESINQISSFLKEIGKDEINILPLHHLGREKYELLQQNYKALKFKIPTIEEIKKVKNIFTENNIKCYINNDTPF